MDDDFFKRLDEALTNVGSDKYWERRIGDHTVWLSPVPFQDQLKINELLAGKGVGQNIFAEVKKSTIAHAIVGFDDFDLRPYRNDEPIFPIYDRREKKNVKVNLCKFLEEKVNRWGTEWIDSAFDVFADLMESLKKENVSQVKFMNARDKREELAELEEKVRELKLELGIPTDKPAEKPVAEEKSEKPEELVSFNPFEKLPEEVVVQTRQAVPVPVPPKEPVRAQEIDLSDSNRTTSSPENPYVVRRYDDVIDSKADKTPAPIELDPVRQSVNPRFKPMR